MKELEVYIQSYFGVRQESLQILSTLFQKETLNKGDFFLKQEQYCQKLSFVKAGYLRIFSQIEEKEITQWISYKDYFVTDLSSFKLQIPARWNIQALSEVELYTISLDNYGKIHQLVKEWGQLESLFLANCFATLENRVFSFLSMSAAERYESLFQMNPELFNQIPLHYLASMLGMTPETFSRIRRNLLS